MLDNNYFTLGNAKDTRYELTSDIQTVSVSLFKKGDGSFILKNSIIIPGLTDVHVHLREPGFFYKETIKTGSLASAHGGFTTVMAMPNLKPVPDSLENLKVQTDIIEKSACINVLPYGSITVGEKGEKVADLEELAPFVCGYSDDGRGIMDDDIMLEAMTRAKKLNKIISAHTEDYKYSGGFIHDGEYAKTHNIKGIPSECEYKQIERDLKLAKMSGCKYHICHVSAKESVELIRQAKREGVDVTAETAPHYLLLDDSMLQDDGKFRMAPPIRSKKDRESLVEAILDGTIDMIATDHAPHSKEEKSQGLTKSINGITGIECAFPLMYTEFVKSGILSLDKLIKLMSTNPNERFSVDNTGNFSVFNVGDAYKIDSNKFLSMGKCTPFDGYLVYGECLFTVCKNKLVYANSKMKDIIK